MITRGLKRVPQSGKHAIAFVQNRRRLSMHDASSPDHFASEYLTDTLMPETDTEHRYSRAEVADHLIADPGVIWRSRPRRNTNSLWLHLFDLFNRRLIVSPNGYLGTELAKVLNQVVGE
jgi:hypothetical protein